VPASAPVTAPARPVSAASSRNSAAPACDTTSRPSALTWTRARLPLRSPEKCLPARDHRSFSSSIFPDQQGTSSYLRSVSPHRHERPRLARRFRRILASRFLDCLMCHGRSSLRGRFSNRRRSRGSDRMTRCRCSALPHPGRGSMLRVAATGSCGAARTARCGGSRTEALLTSAMYCDGGPR
jgi:hypothetical protein